MPEPENRKVVEDAAALAELERFEELQERAVEMGEEIRSLLAPLKDQLQALVVEYDFLYYEALVARFKFFQAAKKADTSLVGHNSMRFERVGDKVYMVWDDMGPRFSPAETSEPPELHVFEQRRPGRRAVDLLHWLR